MSEERPWRDEQRLRRMYVDERMSMREISRKLDCSKRTVQVWLDKFNIETRISSREKPPSINMDEGHERFQSACNGKLDKVYHHQLLAIANGADPEDVFSNGEYHIHHLNGIKWDNRPDNIMVIGSSEHQTHHCLERWERADTPWWDGDKLRALYHGKKMTIREVADEFGIDETTVLRWMKRHDIGRRDRGERV